MLEVPRGAATSYLMGMDGSLIVPRAKHERDLIVVPVHEEVFASARKLRIVAIPITQSSSDVRYLAFYRNAPTSAITHFAPVLKIETNVRYKEIFPSGSDMLRKADMPLKVYHLGPMEVLEHPVKKGWSAPIAGPRYAALEDLREGHYIDEVWPPTTEEAKERLQRRQQEHDARKKRGEQQASTKQARQQPAGAAPEGDATKKKRRRGHRGGRGRKKQRPAGEPVEAEGVARGAQEAVRGAVRPAAPKVAGRAAVHYIVDGANVAMEARKMREGGVLHQVELIMDRLSTVKGAIVTVIVDAGLRHHIDRKDDLERMIERREVLQAPAQTQADEFILMTAEYLRSKGEKVRIVSNDVYADYIKRYKPRFDWVHEVQEQFMFIFGPERDDVLDVMISMS